MANILCVYFSRTGRTERLMNKISGELNCEIVKLSDGVNRKGLYGWVLSGMQAVARKIPPVSRPETKQRLQDYDLVIIATPVWAGRCSAPVRSFLMQFGDELKQAAYVITRSCSLRYEEVFEQMDQYLRSPRLFAVSIEPGSIGSEFWRKEFLGAVYGENREEADHAGQAQDSGEPL